LRFGEIFVGDDDVSASLSKRGRHRFAQSPRSAGDNGDGILQLKLVHNIHRCCSFYLLALVFALVPRTV
jgi:hypothetical protein